MNPLREYIRNLLVEQEAKFSGILKLMPSANIVAQAESIAATLPKETTVSWIVDDEDMPIPQPVKVLSPDKFHVTVAHQSALKPYRKILKVMSKTGQLPPPPPIQLDPAWEERTDLTAQKRSYVSWVVNQEEVGDYLNSIMEIVGGPMNIWETETPPRRFHVSIANLTGNPGDSVR